MPRRPFSPGPAGRRDAGHQRLADVFPGLWRGSTSGWLAGLGQLDDPSAASRFVASRLVYRQLGRRAWLLAVPVLLALLLRLPVALLRPGPHVSGILLATTLGAAVVESVVLVALALVSLRQIWLAFSGRAGGPARLERGGPGRRPGAGQRGLGRSGHGRHQPGGAEPGGHRLLRQRRLLRGRRERVPASRRQHSACRPLSWRPVNWPGSNWRRGTNCTPASFTARSCCRGRPWPSGLLTASAVAAAAGGRRQFPPRAPWPAVPGRVVPHRRSRRLAALVVAAAGFLSLVSDLSAPVAHHLNVLRQLLPLAVPQAAGALAALGGLALLDAGPWDPARPTPGLPRVPGHPGRRRHIAPAGSGQRHRGRSSPWPWPVSCGFGAPRSGPAATWPRLGRALARLVGLAVAAVVAGALALEGTSWVTTTVHHRRSARIGWVQAFQATTERMIGVKHVALPDRLDDFFSPAMFSVTAGLVLVARLDGVPARGGALAPPWQQRGSRTGPGGGRRYGAGTLDYFTLRSDKEFFFWGGTVVAYAVYSGVCLVSPDPVRPAGGA